MPYKSNASSPQAAIIGTANRTVTLSMPGIIAMLLCLSMQNRSAIAILISLGALAALSSCTEKSKSAEATPTASKASGTSFVQIVQDSKPIAYFRLESTSGTTEVGGAAYTSSGGVTNATP